MPRKLNNAELWDALSEVGVGRDKASSPKTSTLAAAPAAGDATFTVVSATGMVANMILRVGKGSDAEIVVISSVSTNVITPKYPLEYAHNVGDDVTEQAKTVLGTIDDNGVTTDSMGQFNDILGATRRQVFGFAGGHWSPKIDFAVENLSLENIAASLGMAESAVLNVSTQYRLAANAAKFGKQMDQWFYFVGVMHDQLTNVEVRLWACEVDWTQALKQKFKRGDAAAAAVPFSVRPTSAIEYILG